MKLSGALKELREIPGVGKRIAMDLYDLGIRSVHDLNGKDPEELYVRSNRLAGKTQDRCLLYAFRCAAYFASRGKHNPELLKWWNWKDKKLPLNKKSITKSVTKSAQK
ncbi:MAG: helix-hairpin-helix domain-containing protein [Deltaproteobacteria bacterium]